MDVQGTENKIKQVDSLLTTLKTVLKKHWGILTIIAICAMGYWIWNLPDEPINDQDPTIHYADTVYDDAGYDYVDYYADSVEHAEAQDTIQFTQ